MEGVNFVPDSEEGGGSDWFFSPDSNDEVSSGRQLMQVEDSEFVPDSLLEEPGSMEEGCGVHLLNPYGLACIFCWPAYLE